MQTHWTQKLTTLGWTTLLVLGLATTISLTGCTEDPGIVDNGFEDPGVPLPAAPSQVVVLQTSNTSVEVRWQDNSDNETGFRIVRTENAGQPQVVAAADAEAESIADEGLQPLGTYVYSVAAYNATGQSTSREPATVTLIDVTEAEIPEAPSGMTVTTISESVLRVSWVDESDDEDAFRLHAGTDPSFNRGSYSTIDLPANTTSYTHPDRAPSTTYYYRLTASNQAGRSSTAAAQGRTDDVAEESPAAPSGLTVTTISGTTLRVDWTDESNDEDGFRLLSSTDPAFNRGFYSVFDLAANTTAFLHTNLSPKTTYYYRLTSYSETAGPSSTVSAQGATDNVQDPPVPAPALFGPGSAEGSFSLDWSYDWPSFEGQFIDRIVLEESSTSPTSGFAEVGQELRNLATHQFDLQKTTGTYYYRVKAVMAFEGELISTPYSGVVTVSVVVTAKKIRIVNDLYDQTDQLGNDWDKLNTLVRVRIASTENDVVFGGDAFERMTPMDRTCQFSFMQSLRPDYQSTTNDIEFDTADQGSTYYVFIQTGWWDSDAFQIGCWDKHVSQVLSCDLSVAYKWAVVIVSAHTSGTQDIRMSEFLPQTNWYQSPFCGSAKAGSRGANGATMELAQP